MSKSHNSRPPQRPRGGATDNTDNTVDGAFTVFCGIDVAREDHHAVALNSSGRRLVDQPLSNDEAALRALFTTLSDHGRLLVVVDQPASIGALAIEVARTLPANLGAAVAYLPGLAMRRLADLHPGSPITCQDRRPRCLRHR